MDKPKTVIKKPALYKMVSFKGVDDSASKETKEIQTGLKANLSAQNSLGGTLNSIALALEKQTTTMRDMVQYQISQKGIQDRYKKKKEADEARAAARQKIEDKKEKQREKRDDAAQVETTSSKVIGGLVEATAKTFGGFFALLGSLASWIMGGIVKFAIFDWMAKNPDKVQRLAKGLFSIGKWAFEITSKLIGFAGGGLLKFLENPLSLQGFFGALQFALGVAPIFATFAILKNPMLAIKGIKAVVGMLFGMVTNLMKATKLGGKLRKVGQGVIGSTLGRTALIGGGAYAAARLSGADQAEAIGTGVGAGAGSAIGSTLGAATGIPGAGMLAGAAGAFVGGAVGGGIGKAMEPIIEPFQKFFAAIGGVFSAIFTPIQEAAGSFFKALGGAFNAVLDFIEPSLPLIKKVGAFFGTVAFAPLIGLMKALTFVLGFFAGGKDKDKKQKPEKPKKKPVKTTVKKTVSGRFNMDTGQAYINDKEVSTDEYVAYFNMSRAEKLAKYGVEVKAAGGAVVVPNMDEGGEAPKSSMLDDMFGMANVIRNIMGKKVTALAKLFTMPIKAVGIAIVSVIAKIGQLFAKFLPGPLKSMLGNFLRPLADVFGIPMGILGTSGGEDADADNAEQEKEGNEVRDLNKAIGKGKESVLGLMGKLVKTLTDEDSPLNKGGKKRNLFNPMTWFAGGGEYSRLPQMAAGGWINGPMSGYPVSLDGGKSTSFIGHGLEWVGYPKKASGGSAFIVPFNTPKTKGNPSLTSRRMREASAKGYALPTFSKGGEHKNITNYKTLIKAGGKVEDTGNVGGFRQVKIMYPPHKVKSGFLGLGTREKRRVFNFGSSEGLNMTTEEFVNLKMADSWSKVTPTTTVSGDVIKPDKRMRGSGAKDRGREGGNFSGQQQKNIRGEYAFKNRVKPENKMDPAARTEMRDPAVMAVKFTLDKAGKVFNKVVDTGKKLLGFKTEENSDRRRAKEEANQAIGAAVEAQNEAVAKMSQGGEGQASQPENTPVVTPNFEQWNEADPYLLSKFTRFREVKADLDYTPRLK